MFRRFVDVVVDHVQSEFNKHLRKDANCASRRYLEINSLQRANLLVLSIRRRSQKKRPNAFADKFATFRILVHRPIVSLSAGSRHREPYWDKDSRTVGIKVVYKLCLACYIQTACSLRLFPGGAPGNPMW